MWIVLACTAPDPTTEREGTPTTPASPTGDTATSPSTTASTGDTAASATGDTGTTTWTGLYPPAPYDCAQGVPPGPPAVTVLPDVRSTEDFAFTTDGWLVSSDWDHNLYKFLPDGTMDPFSPGAGENRGIDVLPDGDVVFTNPNTGTVNRVASNGAVSLITTVESSASGIDVAADGTLAIGSLGWAVNVIDANGAAQEWGRFGLQLYGTAFSPDEDRIYFASYSSSDPVIYATDRQPDGTWSQPSPWTTYSATGLAGMATDMCGNVYAMDAFTCALWRYTPAGDEEQLIDLPIPGGYCPSIAFGRGLGGWDAYKLYVSTYAEVVELDVGVPGRPR